MTEAPLLDVVVAVHTAQRPVERTVGSALADPELPVRVTVVAHGLDAGDLKPRLATTADPRLRVMEHHDGIASPAGPMNAGMLAATAPFVSVIGSDDYYEYGALGAALERAQGGADIAILPIRHAGGARVLTPLPRYGRMQRLDPVRDRLFTRTAPLAIVNRGLMLAAGAPFTEGLASGEDLAISTRLWASGARIDYDSTAPAYVIGADASDRVTTALRPLGEELRAVRLLIADRSVGAYSIAVRRALAAKLARVHLIGAVDRRRDAELLAGELEELSRLAHELDAFAPGFAAPLARAEARVFAALAAGEPWRTVADLNRARHCGPWRDRTLSTRVADSLRTDAVLRRYIRYRLEPGERL
ncbi:glycosyltransferase [Microcella sp.]|uniref:glycosyltransferase n=1 Tax=Microcella sp. TaxID=1913979 RepID=UPI00391CCF73